MRINTNISAMNAHRQLGISNAQGAKSMSRLSTGVRINSAADDAAGLAISEKMRGQIRGLGQASRNAQDGISFIQTAEGALGETHAILQRMRELAVQSATDTNVAVDRDEIQKEMDELAKEVTRISNNTEFNTQKLLNGGITDSGIGAVKFHIGANAGQNVELSIMAMDAKTLGVSRDISSDATGTLASTGNTAITNVSFGSALGAAIVDEAEITFTYNAGQAATQSSITGGGAAVEGTDLTGQAAMMKVTVGTDEYDIDLAGWDGTGTKEQLAAFLATADNGGVALSTVANVTVEAGGEITIALINAGATELKVNFTGADAGDAETLTGLANDDSDTGDALIADTLTVASDTNTQYVTVDGTANSLTISTGAFSGMTIGTGTDTLADIHADDKVTVSAATTVASSAEFSAGALVNEAVTNAGINVSSQATASAAITTLNNAIETVSGERSKLGAAQNRLEHTIKNLDTSAENLQASESRIRDVDMAKEMMEFTKQNILQQAATAMLAQANMAPQSVLQLLG